MALRSMSSNREKLESAIRIAVGKLAPNMTKDGYDEALHWVRIWCTFGPDNRRAFVDLEAGAGAGGSEWRDGVEHLVAAVCRDLPRMATLISSHAKSTKEED